MYRRDRAGHAGANEGPAVEQNGSIICNFFVIFFSNFLHIIITGKLQKHYTLVQFFEVYGQGKALFDMYHSTNFT